MEEKIVNIFDFDGTLFRSPVPNPKLWDNSLIGKIHSTTDQSGLGWFQDIITLSHPYVPLYPEEKWYVAEVKEKVLESMKDPTAITVLLTGRTVQYQSMIKRIVDHAGLQFDEYGLKPGPEVTTLNFKIDFIAKLVSKYQPYRLVLWEDRPTHAEKFTIRLKQKFPYVDCRVIAVPSAETYLPQHLELELIQTLSLNSGNKMDYKEIISFAGVFLDDESCQLLKTRFPPIPGWTEHYHHMTVCLGPLSSNQSLSLGTNLIGTEVVLDVIALGQDRKAYAVQVKGFPSTNIIPHITMCTAPDSKPKFSNHIPNWKPISDPFTIKGKFIEQKKFIAERNPVPNRKTGATGKKVNIGRLIAELTTKKGKEIVDGVKVVLKWMEDNRIENSDENILQMKNFIITNLL